MLVAVSDTDALHRLLIAFVSFERPDVRNFRKAIEHFKENIPKVTAALKNIIKKQETIIQII